MRILVVEDDAGIARGLRTNLKQRGYVVDVCDSVQHAWTSVSVERFDLILLDLGLSDGDGSELLQRIRERGAQGMVDVSVIGHTGGSVDSNSLAGTQVAVQVDHGLRRQVPGKLGA